MARVTLLVVLVVLVVGCAEPVKFESDSSIPLLIGAIENCLVDNIGDDIVSVEDVRPLLASFLALAKSFLEISPAGRSDADLLKAMEWLLSCWEWV